MITLVEALNYRCLRYVQVPLKPFHVLVGPNASGKTTFLDVIGFLSDLVSDGLDKALLERTPNPQDLLFGREGDRFELAVEATIPDKQRESTANPELDTARYQVSIGFDDTQRQFEFKAETFMLKRKAELETPQRSLFPLPPEPPETLLINIHRQDNKGVINKVYGGNDNFYSEVHSRADRRWAPSFKMGSKKSALGNLIADADYFPVATWFRDYLTFGIQNFVLDAVKIKAPSTPTTVSGFLPDGSNLPWVVSRLKEEHPTRYNDWINHLKTALPDLVDIHVTEREEDRHRYMRYEYQDGLMIPSWLVSDGTLRLTALTLPAYLVDKKDIYLIEEPENGINPRSVSTIYASLSSVYGSQILLATHSPVVLNETNYKNILCFAKDKMGATDIVYGPDHPHLRNWQGTVDIGDLFVSGVLE